MMICYHYGAQVFAKPGNTRQARLNRYEVIAKMVGLSRERQGRKRCDGMDTFVTLNLSRSRRRPALLPVEGVEGWMVVVDDDARGLM
jgi:hypothetical protein